MVENSKSYNNLIELKKYNQNKILNIFLNKTLNNNEKQIRLEKNLIFNVNKLYDDNFIFSKQILILRNRLINIDWLNIAGKLYLKKFFKIISVENFINLILIRNLLAIKYFNFYALEFFKNKLKMRFNKYAEFNKIGIIYLENEEKKEKVYISNDLLEKSLSYIVEYLNTIKIISYNANYNRFILTDFSDLCEQESILLISQKWPLIIPAKDYYLKSENLYLGGYFTDNLALNLCIKNELIKGELIVNEKCLNNISKLQNIKYILIQNKVIIDFISELELFFTPEFLTLNIKYLEDWYACYQYLTFIKGNIFEIYFPYVLDFRGRMYNGITYGLNPTSNKLSRILIGFGRYKLNEYLISYLKLYICSCFKISIDNFNDLLNLDLSINNLKYLLDHYSLKSLILLLDWKENVLKTNESEILIEMDASQSGFQVLSLLSNDFMGMTHTNLISSDLGYDLYTQVLNKVLDKLPVKEWGLLLNRNFIKQVIMTIPYGSTRSGQKDMLKSEYIKQYSLTYLIEYNYIPQILNSKIITDPFLLNTINNLIEIIKDSKYSVKIITDVEYKLIKYLMAHNSIFDKFLNIINEVTLDLYANIIKFTENLKKFKLESICTNYVIFSLVYYYVEKDSENKNINIKKRKYTKTIINKFKIDYKKMEVASIANICQGLGDAFIMHHIIENLNCSFYSIHDAILCKADDIDLIKQQVLNSYRYVYNYYLNYSVLDPIRINKTKYELNSLNIFKIK